MLRTGCAWWHLPHDFTVSWSAAHKHFLRWCRNGTWARILTTVRGEVRTRSGRRRRPTAAVVDSSSVKASPVAGPRGFDGAKKVDGVKRHVLVDSGGVLVVAGLFRLIDSIKAFPLIYILTDGGPGSVTEVTNYYSFLQAFNFSYLGYSSAITVIMVAATVVLSWLVFRLVGWGQNAE